MPEQLSNMMMNIEMFHKAKEYISALPTEYKDGILFAQMMAKGGSPMSLFSHSDYKE